ncbi:MAG: thioesterase II family protein [candidate division KSB1 bacterium]|nr:thioesterase II family protein [candidate division KSB1 bacterium]MDZ7357530.1 thioesterase II family protein [candidate division KSB1 bacterium]
MNQNWFAYRKSNPGAVLRLFCLPYAGGSAMVYRNWSDLLPQTIEVCPIELPGRGARLQQPAFREMMPLVEALGDALMPYLDKPYAFFGHSMGALIAFELARWFRRLKLPAAQALFASGHTAPHLGCSHDPIYNLPDEAFKAKLRQLNGTPEAVIKNDELMTLLIPMLRADFQVNETYHYDTEPPLAIPIIAFGGNEDHDVSISSLQAWQHQTSAGFSLHIFEGGHFFLQSAQSQVLQTLTEHLKKILMKLI